MGFFDFLKTTKATRPTAQRGTYFTTSIDDASLTALIDNALSVFETNAGADHDTLIDLIKGYHDDEALALALYRFIPIACCRLFIPEPAYSDQYVLYKSENDKTAYHFSKDAIYTLVLSVCAERLKQSLSSETIFSILYHSAEFKAINSALLKGSDLNDLVCSPAYFL